MKIIIVSSTGTGKTLLSAFDKALINAGINNYNLITLSSVIPPQSDIVEKDKYEAPQNEFGHKLFLVKAEIRSDKEGTALASGVGWYQLDGNQGFFVEHEIEGESEEFVRNWVQTQITSSLEDLLIHRGLPFDPKKVHMKVTSAIVKGSPTSVLTAAVYNSQGW